MYNKMDNTNSNKQIPEKEHNEPSFRKITILTEINLISDKYKLTRNLALRTRLQQTKLSMDQTILNMPTLDKYETA
jgi:hypothetical protein